MGVIFAITAYNKTFKLNHTILDVYFRKTESFSGTLLEDDDMNTTRYEVAPCKEKDFNMNSHT